MSDVQVIYLLIGENSKTQFTQTPLRGDDKLPNRDRDPTPHRLNIFHPKFPQVHILRIPIPIEPIGWQIHFIHSTTMGRQSIRLPGEFMRIEVCAMRVCVCVEASVGDNIGFSTNTIFAHILNNRPWGKKTQSNQKRARTEAIMWARQNFNGQW